MDSAICFEDKEASALNEFVSPHNQEEIVHENLLTLTQLHLCILEIEIDIQSFQEFRNRIFVGIAFLLDYFHC